MRRILDQTEVVAPGDPHELVHGGRMAGEVHRNDRARAVRDPSLDVARIEIEGIGRDVREHGPRSPACTMVESVAVNVRVLVMTSASGGSSSASSARWSAAVQEFTAIACGAPVASAKARSNS